MCISVYKYVKEKTTQSIFDATSDLWILKVAISSLLLPRGYKHPSNLLIPVLEFLCIVADTLSITNCLRHPPINLY